MKELVEGVRKPKTYAQKRFVAVFKGAYKLRTKYEIIWSRYCNCLKADIACRAAKHHQKQNKKQQPPASIRRKPERVPARPVRKEPDTYNLPWDYEGPLYTVDHGFGGSREDTKKMHGQRYGDMNKRSREG